MVSFKEKFILWFLKVAEWFTFERSFKILVFVTVINMFFYGSLLIQVSSTQKVSRETGQGNRSILESIEDATSSEAQKKQTELINFVIDRVDCNNQAALQRTIDVLVDRGILKPGEVKAITKACEDQVFQNKT